MSEGEIERLKRLKSGDGVRVGGEKFTVSHKTGEGLILTPRNENGEAKLDWDQLNGRLIYSRHRGVDPCDVDTEVDCDV